MLRSTASFVLANLYRCSLRSLFQETRASYNSPYGIDLGDSRRRVSVASGCNLVKQKDDTSIAHWRSPLRWERRRISCTSAYHRCTRRLRSVNIAVCKRPCSSTAPTRWGRVVRQDAHAHLLLPSRGSPAGAGFRGRFAIARGLAAVAADSQEPCGRPCTHGLIGFGLRCVRR
jgi:hypothetical protein